MLTLIQNDEGKILNLIESLAPTEWRKYQERYPVAWIGNRMQRIDYSSRPPYWSFRFVRENPKLIKELTRALESYHGKVEWVMVYHERNSLPGKNWMICTKKSWLAREAALEAGISVGEYLSENEPEFGPNAYDDIGGLESHLRERLLSCPDNEPTDRHGLF